ncbi:outer membrane protein [Rhizobium sp. CC-YZS058]|uniref:outer membrane protein n=1 Tax=Rhizobium sp. CC-YZS058 TaxID=3042153 RepID=UPI002B059223|nr:outer membrane protein [Rhizobium sp. CC-YZS058]MEA3535341.1 outer membrane protein [Rhizobium sp. CC-YZS058]
MRTLITTLMASAMSFAAFSAAQAADAIDEVPAAPAAAYSEPVVKNWSGAYVGGTANWNHGEFKATGDRTAAGFGGGLYTGYNMQNGQIVYGAETDINYQDTDVDGDARSMKQGVNGSLRARVGYDLNPVLVYGTAGVAAADIKARQNGGSDSKTAIGWTAGGGAEAFVTDNITARVEYRYTDYGSKSFDVPGRNFSSGYDEHSVKVGMGVKF